MDFLTGVLWWIIGIIALMIALPIIGVVIQTHEENKKREQQEMMERREAREREEQAKREQAEAEARAREALAERKSRIQAAVERCPGAAAYLTGSKAHTRRSYLTVDQMDKETSFVALDTETTGLSSGADEIIEIACVRVRDGAITDEYTTLVHPRIPIPDAASRVNHITDEMVEHAPTIEDVLPEIRAFIGESVVAAHNARFDADFLEVDCWNCGFIPPSRYFDTMRLAEFYDVPNKKLKTLLSAARIKNTAEHRALGDARAVAQLILTTNERRKAAET